MILNNVRCKCMFLLLLSSKNTIIYLFIDCFTYVVDRRRRKIRRKGWNIRNPIGSYRTFRWRCHLSLRCGCNIRCTDSSGHRTSLSRHRSTMERMRLVQIYGSRLRSHERIRISNREYRCHVDLGTSQGGEFQTGNEREHC